MRIPRDPRPELARETRLMSETPAERRPRLFQLYNAAVILAAVVLLIATPAGHTPPALALGLAGLLMLLNELLPVDLPGGGYATASAVVDIPCLVILGPHWTAMLDVLSTFVAQGLVIRKSPVRVVHDTALVRMT